jgi:hypothetical protein
MLRYLLVIAVDEARTPFICVAMLVRLLYNIMAVLFCCPGAAGDAGQRLYSMPTPWSLLAMTGQALAAVTLQTSHRDGFWAFDLLVPTKTPDLAWRLYR